MCGNNNNNNNNKLQVQVGSLLMSVFPRLLSRKTLLARCVESATSSFLQSSSPTKLNSTI